MLETGRQKLHESWEIEEVPTMVDANAEEFTDLGNSRERITAPLTMTTIISVGTEAGILRKRQQEIASRTGMRVRWIPPSEAEVMARRPGKHLWMFCATVEYSQAMYLACSVRRYRPESRLLLLQEQETPGFEKPLFDEVVRMPASMESIVSAVRRLARR